MCETEKEGRKKKSIIPTVVILVVLVAVIAVGVFVWLNVKHVDANAQKVADRFMTAIEDKDVNALIDVYDPEVISYTKQLNDYSDDNIKGFYKELVIDTIYSKWKSAGKIKSISHSVRGVRMYDDEQLRESRQTFEKEMGYSFDKCGEVLMDVTVTGSKKTLNQQMVVYIYKYEGEWYYYYYEIR